MHISLVSAKIKYEEWQIKDVVKAYDDGLSSIAIEKYFGIEKHTTMRWVNSRSKMRTKLEAFEIESKNLKGISRNPRTQFKTGHKTWNKGITRPEISGENHWLYGKSHEAVRGSKNVNWKGGVTTKNEQARKIPLYKTWRECILYKDDWTCQSCGKRGVKLTAHHVKSFSNNPELRYSLLNGITLCEVCHANRHPELNYKSLVGAN